ncbi:MAG: DUF4476 domain-containing protein [Spirochaetales bacterium]|nr:DUF4476 domain-containing protein [Spirochaetales bacterium]
MKLTACMVFIFFLFSFTLVAEEDMSQDEIKTKVLQNLTEIKDSYLKLLNFEQRREAITLIDEIIALVEKNSTMPSVNQYNVLSENGFRLLQKQVEATLSESQKTEYILSIGKSGYITTDQLLILLKSYHFDLEIADCIKKIYPQILDKVNAHVLLTTINSSIIKDELMKFFAAQ